MNLLPHQLRVVGTVESPLADRDAAPLQGDEGAPQAGIAGDAITVRDLEAIDGTPVIDVKPLLGQVHER